MVANRICIKGKICRMGFHDDMIDHMEHRMWGPTFELLKEKGFLTIKEDGSVITLSMGVPLTKYRVKELLEKEEELKLVKSKKARRSWRIFPVTDDCED